METHIFYVNVQSPKQTKKTPNTTNDVVGFSVVYGHCAFSKDSRKSVSPVLSHSRGNYNECSYR